MTAELIHRLFQAPWWVWPVLLLLLFIVVAVVMVAVDDFSNTIGV